MSDVTLTSSVPAVIIANTTATREGRLATAINISADAKQLSPVATGQMQNSIGYGEIDENAAHASVNTDYAINVEFGTKNQAAQPFMRPAKDLSEGKNVEDVKRLIIERVKKAEDIRRKLS